MPAGHPFPEGPEHHRNAVYLYCLKAPNHGQLVKGIQPALEHFDIGESVLKLE